MHETIALLTSIREWEIQFVSGRVDINAYIQQSQVKTQSSERVITEDGVDCWKVRNMIHYNCNYFRKMLVIWEMATKSLTWSIKYFHFQKAYYIWPQVGRTSLFWFSWLGSHVQGLKLLQEQMHVLWKKQINKSISLKNKSISLKGNPSTQSCWLFY